MAPTGLYVSTTFLIVEMPEIGKEPSISPRIIWVIRSSYCGHSYRKGSQIRNPLTGRLKEYDNVSSVDIDSSDVSAKAESKIRILSSTNMLSSDNCKDIREIIKDNKGLDDDDFYGDVYQSVSVEEGTSDEYNTIPSSIIYSEVCSYPSHVDDMDMARAIQLLLSEQEGQPIHLSSEVDFTMVNGGSNRVIITVSPMDTRCSLKQVAGYRRLLGKAVGECMNESSIRLTVQRFDWRSVNHGDA